MGASMCGEGRDPNRSPDNPPLTDRTTASSSTPLPPQPVEAEETLSDTDSDRRSETPAEYDPKYQDVGQYCVDMKEKIGQGKYGIVYWGVDRSSAMVVAVKECPTPDQSLINSAMTEMKVLKSVSHANLLQYLSVELKPKTIWIMTEYCELGQLDNYFGKFHPIPDAVKVEFMTQIHRALTYMHTLPSKVVHRDIKPANILVKYGEEEQRPLIRVADFGLAAIAKTDHALDFSATNAAGNAAFMAPEMAKEETYDEGIDIFSSGLVFLAMLQYDKGKSQTMMPHPDPGQGSMFVSIGQLMALDKTVRVGGNVSTDSQLMKSVKVHIRKMIAPKRKDRINTAKSLQEMGKIFDGVKNSLPPPPKRRSPKLPHSIRKLLAQVHSSLRRASVSSDASTSSDRSLDTDLGDDVMKAVFEALEKQAEERRKEEEREEEERMRQQLTRTNREDEGEQQDDDDESNTAAAVLQGLLVMHLLGQLQEESGGKDVGFEPEKAHKWSDEWFIVVVGEELRLLSNNIAVILTETSNGWFNLYMKHKLVMMLSSGVFMENTDAETPEYRHFIMKLQEAHQFLRKDPDMRIVFQNPNPHGVITFGTWTIRSTEAGKLHIGNTQSSEQTIMLEQGLSGLVFHSTTGNNIFVRSNVNINPVYLYGMLHLQQRGLTQLGFYQQ